MAGARVPMRPWLRWGLGLTVLLSAVALWWPAERVASVVAQAQSHSLAAEQLGAAAVGDSRAPVPLSGAFAGIALPHHLPKLAFDKAEFDPFVGVVPSPPPAVKPPPVMTPPPPSPPPFTRQPPPQSYRYMGALVDPSGQQWVYLARGDGALSVAVGTQLDEGYVVEAIDPDGVRLLYAPMDARVVIPIPPPRNAPAQ